MTSYVYICGILLTIISIITFFKEVFNLFGGDNLGLKVFKLIVSISASWVIPVAILGGITAIQELRVSDMSGFLLWLLSYPMVIMCFIGLQMILYNKIQEQ